MPALELHHITKRFGEFTAVDDISLAVERGELLGFLGPNGAGKTTTLRMVMNIIAPDAGELRILGQPLAGDVKDRVGYLPEERGLYRKMTVEATLRYFGRLKGLGGADLARRIDESLERVALGEWRGKRVEALSKGMQQKLQLMCSLLNEPELVILDEPFSGLDPINIDLLKQLILELRDRGVTVIFSTHVMEQAEKICDRILLINRGRKLTEGTLPEIRAQFPAHSVALAGEGDFGPLRDHPLVKVAHVRQGGAELEIVEGGDPNAIVTAATATARVTRFELRQPDLQEIFVRLVQGDAIVATTAEDA